MTHFFLSAWLFLLELFGVFLDPNGLGFASVFKVFCARERK